MSPGEPRGMFLAGYDPRVYDKILHVMNQDEDADVRDAAYNVLVRLARIRATQS